MVVRQHMFMTTLTGLLRKQTVMEKVNHSNMMVMATLLNILINLVERLSAHMTKIIILLEHQREL